MQPVGVVDVFDEGADAGVGVGEIGVGSPVDLLGVQRLHEAFGLGVVVRVYGDAPVISLYRPTPTRRPSARAATSLTAR